MTAPAHLDVQGVTKRFRGRRGEVTALENIDLQVARGELVCIVGASGGGKSTLLSIIAGLTEPTAGVVLVDGVPVVGPGPDRGLVFQGYSLYPWRSVAQNIAFGLEIARLPREEQDRRVDFYLDVMKLTRWRDAHPSQLSGGMRQRVAIARALATEPEVLLLDEPFGSLDAHTKSLMQDFLLDAWRRTGASVLMVTHDIEEAIFLAQRIYVLSSHPGRIKEELPVPFGPERGAGIRRDPAFLDLVDRIRALLLAEVTDL